MQPASPATLELLVIGNELLLGETVDTNSAWIAQRLAREGIRVARRTTVPDDETAIRDALAAALARARIVICTGGLGPTADDVTRAAVAAFYGRELRQDDGWLQVLRDRYAKRGIEMPAINHVQALLPAGADLLFNERGTAPGIVIDDVALGMSILLPGVPGELRDLMERAVVPLLRSRLPARGTVESRLLRTAGLSEAALAERIADITDALMSDASAEAPALDAPTLEAPALEAPALEPPASGAPITLAFLPHTSGVDLRLTCWGSLAGEAAAAELDRITARLRDRLGHHVYAEDDVDLAVVVGRMLRERGLTITMAESCTGGLLSKRLTDEAGASDYLHTAFVTYANEAKSELLGVRPETLATHGAVSEECAREMAAGARRAAAADVGVSITGIAGPGGGSEPKPVGTVWFAVALTDELSRQLRRDTPIVTHRAVLPGTRSDIRERAAQTALDLVRRTLTPATAEPS